MENENKIIAQIKKLIVDKYTLPSRDQLLEAFERYKATPIDLLISLFNLEYGELDWAKIEGRLLEEIAIKHELGVGLIAHNEQYDKNWYSNFKQENPQSFYWSRFYDKQKEILPPQVLYTLAQDTEQVLNLCGAPNRQEQKSVRGLIFGFVQSGKTLNYVSITNAAMDAGYNLIVILAGATNILRKQTQNRVIEDVIGWNGVSDVGVGLIKFEAARRPTSLTTPDLDFDRQIARQMMGGYTLETVTVPVIAVIKKNINALNNINTWLESQTRAGMINKSILLIDDESDYASVNTRAEEDPSAINGAIRTMLNKFQVSTYLAITATPFANILIDIDNQNPEHGYDLFPRSFIWTLDKPSTYMGVKEIVIERYKNVIKLNGPEFEQVNQNIVDNILKIKRETTFNKLPNFVFDALQDFIYSCVKIRQTMGHNAPLSMMVNLSRFTFHHIELAQLLLQEVFEMQQQIRNYNIQVCENDSLKRIYNKYLSDGDFYNNCDLDSFNRIIALIINGIDIIDVHSASKREIAFDGRRSLNYIVVGGLSLSRGFTIEGLITSVFLRSTKTYDALMQMGRWFGHKKQFADYISLYTSPQIRLRFETIQAATEDLIAQLITMHERRQTPSEFGLNIQYNPEIGMQVVAANRARNAQRMTIDMSMEGRLCETNKVWSNELKQQHNDEITDRFFGQIVAEGQKVNFGENLYLPGKRDEYAYKAVPIKYLLQYISDFELPHKLLSQISNKMPFYFLSRHLEEWCVDFDFLLVEGEGQPLFTIPALNTSIKPSKRIVNVMDDYLQLKNNQLSTGAGEESAFLDKKYGTRNAARLARGKLFPKRPLMLMYRINARVECEGVVEPLNALDFESSTIWGWSIIIPDTGAERKHKIAYANSVLLKKLAEEAGFENEADYLNNYNEQEE
jgi:hypothetical protein